jgi:hypothetical protein
MRSDRWKDWSVNVVQGLLAQVGLKIAKLPTFPNIDPADEATYQAVRAYTMTSAARVHALIESVRYIVREDIPGAIVECGVWKGGSMMAALQTLVAAGVTDREAYLFDTFEGMTEPGDEDGALEKKIFRKMAREDGTSDWIRAGLDEVCGHIASCGYPMERIHFCKGRVEHTIPAGAPDRIALLRLDTDGYASTLHELEHLYPRLQEDGVLIIDDYGTWEGARRAVDEYFFRERPRRFFLHRFDDTGRLWIKT